MRWKKLIPESRESSEINSIDIEDFGDRLEYLEGIKISKIMDDEAEKVGSSGTDANEISEE